MDLQANDALLSALNPGTLESGSLNSVESGNGIAQPANRRGPSLQINRGTAAEQVLASELNGRPESSDALSMMVSSMVHMVQAGKTRSASNRWSA